MFILPTLLLSVVITIGLIPVLKLFALHFNAVDMPNHRKVHTTPMPKVGGVAMALGAVVPVLLWSPGDRFVNALLLGGGILVVFGFMDDIRDMGYRGKLFGQILSALIVVGYGGVSIRFLGDCLPAGVAVHPWIAVPVTLLVIVGVTNAINLSDGLDGLAGGISMMIFICLGFVAYQNNMPSIAVISMAVIGAIFGFLRFNTHPAVVFMGDAGSQLLGFLAISLALYISQFSPPVNRMFPLLLLGFPILDTLTVMFERIAKGMSPFTADKNHFHHRLMRLGMRHGEAVVAIYTLQFILVLSSFLLRFHSEWVLLFIYSVFCFVVLLLSRQADRHGWTFPRHGLLDRMIDNHLALLRNRRLLIKVLFNALEIAVPLLLFITCLVATPVARHAGYIAFAILPVLVMIWLIRRPWLTAAIRVILFLMIPYTVFQSHLALPQIVSGNARILFDLAYGAAVFLAVLTLKFTRRTKGFKANPSDILIIFVSFIVTRLPEIRNVVQDVSLITTKMIALLFAFEVLIGETRGNVNKLTLFICFSLGVVVLKTVI